MEKIVLKYAGYFESFKEERWIMPGIEPPGSRLEQSALDKEVARIIFGCKRTVVSGSSVMQIELDDQSQKALAAIGFFKKAAALGIKVEASQN